MHLCQPANCFRFHVQVSAADEAADQALLLDGDPQGVKRVLEALEAHTWPGLQLKVSSSNGVPADHASEPSIASEIETPGSSYRQYWPSHVEGMHENGSTQNSSRNLRTAQEEPGDGAPGVPSGGENGAPNGTGNGVNGFQDGESGEDDELSRFEQMLGRLSEVRQQLQRIPDDERRARAAALAMQMMDSLGLDDDDDGADDPSDSD